VRVLALERVERLVQVGEELVVLRVDLVRVFIVTTATRSRRSISQLTFDLLPAQPGSVLSVVERTLAVFEAGIKNG